MAHTIICEICGARTTNGIIIKDNGRSDRHFCSDECIDKKIKEIEEKEEKTKERNSRPWYIRMWST